MADYTRQGFTSVRGLNTRGSIAFRFVADTYGNESTLAVKPSEDAPYQYYMPQKSGTLPIMGTFQVDIPVVTSTTNIFSTIATVSGIRAEDALVVFLNRGITAGYDIFAAGSGSTSRILFGATPGNGNITLGFLNNGLTTSAISLVYSYLAMR
jgi:hypothetical protein